MDAISSQLLVQHSQLMELILPSQSQDTNHPQTTPIPNTNMKTATQIYDTVKKSCEETPFKEIEFSGTGLIRLYWSKRQGANGYQVQAIVHDYQSDEPKVTHFKTNGYGFCKESQSYWQALRCLGLMSKEDKRRNHGSDGVNYNYFVGGNFYRVPKSQQVKYK